MRVAALDLPAAVGVHFFGHRSGADGVDGLHFLQNFKKSGYYWLFTVDVGFSPFFDLDSIQHYSALLNRFLLQ